MFFCLPTTLTPSLQPQETLCRTPTVYTQVQQLVWPIGSFLTMSSHLSSPPLSPPDSSRSFPLESARRRLLNSPPSHPHSHSHSPPPPYDDARRRAPIVTPAQSVEAALSQLDRSPQEIDAVAILKKPPSSRTLDEHHRVHDWLNAAHPRIFHEFASGVVRELVTRLQYAAFGRREIVFHQGDAADAMYIIIRGSVSMWALPLAMETIKPQEKEEVTANTKESEAGDATSRHTSKSSTPSSSQRGSRRNSLVKCDASVTSVPSGVSAAISHHSLSSSSPPPPHARRIRRSQSPSAKSAPTTHAPSTHTHGGNNELSHHASNAGGIDKLTSDIFSGSAHPPHPPSQHSGHSPASGVPGSPISPQSNPLYVKRTARSEARDFLNDPPLIPPHLLDLARSHGLDSWRAKFLLLGTLRAGGAKVVFGESGLLLPAAVRSATIRAEEMPTETLTVSKADFDQILKGSFHADLNAKFDMLSTIQLFQLPSSASAAAAAAAATPVSPIVSSLESVKSFPSPRDSSPKRSAPAASQAAPTARRDNGAAAFGRRVSVTLNGVDSKKQTPAGSKRASLLRTPSKATLTVDAAALVSPASVSSSSDPFSPVSPAASVVASPDSGPAPSLPGPDTSTTSAAHTASLKKLVLYFTQKTLPARATIVTQHTPANFVYCIVRGEVEIVHQLAPPAPPQDDSDDDQPYGQPNSSLTLERLKIPIRMTESFAGKFAGGYGSMGKLSKRAEQVSQRIRKKPVDPHARADAEGRPPTLILLGILGAGMCFGEMDHLHKSPVTQTHTHHTRAVFNMSQTSEGAGRTHRHHSFGYHPFGLRARTAVSLLVISRDDWMKRVLGGPLGGGLLDRATLRKLRARDAWRIERARELDTRHLEQTLRPAEPWKNEKKVQIEKVQQAVSAQQTIHTGERVMSGPSSSSSGASVSSRKDIVSPSGFAGWQSIRDLGDITAPEQLITHIKHEQQQQTTRTNNSTMTTTTTTRHRERQSFQEQVREESKEFGLDRASFPSLSTPRGVSITSPPHGHTHGASFSSPTPIAPAPAPFSSSLALDLSRIRLVSPSPSTARLLQSHRSSHANLPQQTPRAEEPIMDQRTHEGYFQTPPSGATLAAAMASAPAGFVSSSCIAPLPADLALGRELGASKSLRELEWDRALHRRLEDAKLAPKKVSTQPLVSQYAIGVYHAQVVPPHQTHRARRFRGTYDQANTSAPTKTIEQHKLIQPAEDVEPLPEPYELGE